MSPSITFYVEQHPSFALGNFVNVTPTIMRLWLEHRKPIPVWFGTEYVKQAYEDSPYIQAIQQPQGTKIASSGMICAENTMPDYKWVQKQVFGDVSDTLGFAHIDPTWNKVYRQLSEREKYNVLIVGSGNESENYQRLKLPDISHYIEVAKNGNCIFTGSVADLNRAKDLLPYCKGVCVGNIRQSIALINNAEKVISNDTGLAHIAGALQKETHIFWKDTKFTKNMNMGANSYYYKQDKWAELVHKVNFSKL